MKNSLSFQSPAGLQELHQTEYVANRQEVLCYPCLRQDLMSNRTEAQSLVDSRAQDGVTTSAVTHLCASTSSACCHSSRRPASVSSKMLTHCISCPIHSGHNRLLLTGPASAPHSLLKQDLFSLVTTEPRERHGAAPGEGQAGKGSSARGQPGTGTGSLG